MSETVDENTDATNRVGPIIFGHPTARDQLLSEGIVATFRSKKRSTGETWARWERTGPKKADVVVREVGETELSDPDDLPWFTFGTYAKWSGFGTPKAWADAIRDVHGDVSEGIIYEVELVENELLVCAECGNSAPDCWCEGAQCPNCHGKGYIINCVDDICHSKGRCMHGDDKPCARCSDGLVYPKRIPVSEADF